MATSGAVTRVAAYPGTFDPPTIAHLAVAEAARRACGVDLVELVLSVDPIGKAGATPVEERVAALEAAVAGHDWLTVAVSEHRLISDVAAGYDVVVMGADKWAQVLDPTYHPSEDEWRASLAKLPAIVAVARRGDLPIEGDVLVLEVDLGEVSSTAVREGRTDWRAF
jgi:cytidyltransferase-like protein